MLFFLLPVQGSVKRRYPFPEGSSFLVTPLGNRALASSSESEGMTMTFSPGWDRHRNRGVLSIGRRAKKRAFICDLWLLLFCSVFKDKNELYDSFCSEV